jgi:hypothetical protein
MTTEAASFTREDVAAMPPDRRAELARWLADVDPPRSAIAPARIQRRRRLVIGVTAASAVVLVPWTVWLSVSLPEAHRAREWRTAWVGFDILLIVALFATAWAGWHRRQALTGLLIVSGTLLTSDAWFDVLLSSGRMGRTESIVTAVLVELPLAAFFFCTAYRIMRATTATMWHLQGRRGPLPSSFWRLPLLVGPPAPPAPHPAATTARMSSP